MDSSDDEPGHLVIQVPGNLLKVDNDHDVDDEDDDDGEDDDYNGANCFVTSYNLSFWIVVKGFSNLPEKFLLAVLQCGVARLPLADKPDPMFWQFSLFEGAYFFVCYFVSLFLIFWVHLYWFGKLQIEVKTTNIYLFHADASVASCHLPAVGAEVPG